MSEFGTGFLAGLSIGFAIGFIVMVIYSFGQTVRHDERSIRERTDEAND